ncbi:hypothetical protein D3C85_1874280 [compost metagenome]
MAQQPYRDVAFCVIAHLPLGAWAKSRWRRAAVDQQPGAQVDTGVGEQGQGGGTFGPGFAHKLKARALIDTT